MAAEGGKITIVENKLSKTRVIRLLSCLIEDTLAQVLNIINIEDFFGMFPKSVIMLPSNLHPFLKPVRINML